MRRPNFAIDKMKKKMVLNQGGSRVGYEGSE